MNSSVIQKCVEELAKDDPRLDYVRGMLDTLLSLNPVPTLQTLGINTSATPTTPYIPPPQDEAALLDAKAAALLSKMPPLEIQ